MLYQDFLKNKLLDFINKEFFQEDSLETFETLGFSIEIPNNKKFGDLSTNVAMILSKKINLKPNIIAEKITNELLENNFIEKLDVVGPGFINIFFKDFFWQDQLKELISNIEKYKYNSKKKKNLFRICFSKSNWFNAHWSCQRCRSW